MELNERIKTLAQLGSRISNLSNEEWQDITQKAESKNSWFTSKFVKQAFEGISIFLNERDLTAWTAQYFIKDQQKIIGLVMAGNIPLVGFHDLMSVFISGNKVAAKTSSQDDYLMSLVIDWLVEIDPRTSQLIEKVDRLNHVDAVIATGSDNTSRYFRYYFNKKPHIIRQNRTSVGILSGEETEADMLALADDVFMYFGLGCRNVSKIYVPKGYNFQQILDIWGLSAHQELMNHSKYINNYTYNKSIFLINQNDHFDTGFLLLQENTALVSPTSVLYYQYYGSPAQLQLLLAEQREKIQCMVGNVAWMEGIIPFGTAQQPGLADYADGVDTMEFLCRLGG